MAKLGEAHIEQAKVMRSEGKSIREIKEYLNTTYNAQFTDYNVSSAIKDKEGGEVEKLTAKAKRPYKKRKVVAQPDVASDDRVVKDILALVAEIHAGYKLVFKHLRTELIRSRAEVCAMLTGAGLDIPKSDIE